MPMIAITGTIVRGKGEGRLMGYPTANFGYESPMRPESGVWTCHSEIEGRIIKGLAIIGMWKLPNGLPSCEVHYLDFVGDLYEREYTVFLKTKMRELEIFQDLASLQRQIRRDIEEARTAFEVEQDE